METMSMGSSSLYTYPPFVSLALSVLDLKWPRFLCSSFHQEVCFPRPAMWASKVTRFDQHKVREHWQAASCRALLKYRGLWRGLGAALSGWQALRSDSQHHHTCEGPCLGHSAQPHVVRWRSCRRDPRQGLQIGPPEPSPNCQHRRSSFPHPHTGFPASENYHLIPFIICSAWNTPPVFDDLCSSDMVSGPCMYLVTLLWTPSRWPNFSLNCVAVGIENSVSKMICFF